MRSTFNATLAALTIALAGCSDLSTTAPDPTRPGLAPHSPHFTSWPDSASFVAAGIPMGSIAPSSTASFLSGYTQAEIDGSWHFTWANDVQLKVAGYLRNSSNTTLNGDSSSGHWYRFALPVSSGDTAYHFIMSTASRKCGLIAKNHASGTVYQKLTGASGSEVVMWSQSLDIAGNDVSEPACSPPKAKMVLSHGNASGVDIDLSLPDGEVALVGINGTGSGAAEDGGPPISTYDWKLGSTDVGGSSSLSANFSNTMTVALTVTDQDGVNGMQNGSVTITPVDPCDDPLTHGVEDCTTNPPSPNETVSYGGDGSEPATYVGGGDNSTYVCYVTDWYEWNGTRWIYDSTDIDYCTYE